MSRLATRDALRFRRLVRQLHRLGPRPLLEVAGDLDLLLYARFTPAQLAVFRS